MPRPKCDERDHQAEGVGSFTALPLYETRGKRSPNHCCNDGPLRVPDQRESQKYGGGDGPPATMFARRQSDSGRDRAGKKRCQDPECGCVSVHRSPYADAHRHRRAQREHDPLHVGDCSVRTRLLSSCLIGLVAFGRWRNRESTSKS